MAPGGSQTTVGVTVAANMDVSGILNGVKSMQGAFNGLKLPANLTGDAIKQFDKLKESLTKYRELMEKGPSTKADLKQLEKLEKTIKSSFSDLSKVYDELSGKKIYLEADATAIKNAQKDIDQLKQDVQNKLGSIKFEFSSPTKGKVDIGLNELVSDMERAVKSSKTVSASMKEMTNSVKSGNFTDAAKGLTQIEQQAIKLKGASVGLLKTFQQMGLIQFNKSAEDLYKSGEHVALLHQGFEKLRGVLSADDAELKRVTKSLGDAIDKKSELEKIGERNYNNNLAKQAQDADQLKQGYDQCAEAARGFAQQSMSAAQQVEQLQQSTQYFFSLRNMINLLKRGIDEAVQSVKELDKAMTETAVVTDYKVSDLWGMLPEYTKVANQLGATTQGAYETMTLYYQQGLEQQQAFELGAETMKMARIAGLDYAETTDMMTAALRGFNMELNETSAKRVNDVYSELAAITASDTEELGTAMQRTASIAASAGASFEGTTAFLAQAIETTREPAENIGTAMKTIVARFQEMKKNPLEISEVDGEEVDYNKIDAALKTIGVDLKDTNGQFRDFDQVMLDISARWDSLSQSQQRYIATTAAGSRQQSRFIAMVSNYERTMQLMEAANNSAGASDEQFGKTMDSLESKLNQLHNAWQQFTMGIANNGMIKMAVDGLTGFLNITNKIIDTLSLGSGALKSFLSVFAAFTGLKIAGRGANALIGGLGGLVDPKSSVKEGLKIGLFGQGKNAAQAKAITVPIVGSLSKISGQVAAIAKRQGIKDAGQRGSTAGVKETSKEDYANTKRLFSQLSGKEGFKMGDTSKLFGNLDAKHQLSMFNNSPGTKLAMKQASLNWFNSKGLSKELTNEGKQFINSIYKGMSQGQIPVDKGIELIGQPQKWGQYFGTDMAKGFSSSFAKESTQQAHQQAMQYLVGNPDAYGFRSNEFKDWYKNQATDAQKEAYAKYFRQAIDKRQGHGEAKGVVSDMGRFANDIGSVADKFTQAGYGITTFGNALSQLGGPLGAVGTGIAAFGGAVSTIGASISGATGIISLFTVGITDATGAVVVAGSTIAAVAAPLAAAAAAFLLVRAHIKKVKEAGEEVSKTFNETNKTVSDNITKLKSYQSEFAVLSKGVDSNGNNVSLDDSQYQRYLEIVEDIAAINPSIVEGYNAQGHAIINNNKALTETLKLQEESQKKALEDYTKTDSLQKLINARNLNNDFKGINIKGSSPGVYDGSGHGNEGRQKPVGLGKDVSTIADQLRLLQGTDALGNTIRINDEMLQKYGIESLDALISGEEQAVKNFIKHRDKIQADLTNSGFELSESVTKGFETLDKDANAFDEAIKPVYDNLLANVSNSKAFESVAPEFREALNMGLKDLASQDLSAGEMSRAATTMATKFANLTTGSGKYQEAMDKVADAQEKFAANLEETEYRANVQPAIDDLVRLKEEALKEGGAYGQALAEYLDNQIERIANFTEEGTTTIQEGLNTATDAIAQAESALDNFNEATKKDFSTAAEGMRGIYDKIFETYKDSYGNELEKHTEGEGDNTFWTGAEALLSENKLAGGVKEVTKSLKELEPWLREGKEGMDAFFMDVINNDKLKQLQEDGLISLDERGWFAEIPEDQWSAVADALGISEDLLTSMLNKARQFGLIEFDNLEKVREALATSDSAISGIESNAKGQKALYVKEDTMRQNLREAGYNTKESQDKVIEKLLNEQNVNMVKTMKNLSKQDATDLVEAWGVKDLPDLITKMTETGDYNREEILDMAEKAGLGSGEAAADVYDKVISALENPELAEQTSELQSINAKLDAIIEKETGKGIEDHEAAQKEAHEASLGENGMATMFAAGRDTNGFLLDEGNFAVIRNELESTKKQYEETAQYYDERAKMATEAERSRFEKLADLYRSDAEAIGKAIDTGNDVAERKRKAQENKKKTKKDKETQEEIASKESKTPSKESKTPIVAYTDTGTSTKTKTEKVEKTETTTYKAKVDTSFTKVQKEAQELTDLTKEEYALKLDVATEQLDEAREDIYLVQSTVDENLLLVCKADTGEIIATQQKVVDTQNQANKGVNLVSKGDTSGIDKVKKALSPVAGKYFSATLNVATGGALSTLTSIWNVLQKIINNKSKATHIGGGGGHAEQGAYKGLNNHGTASIPVIGSAARGNYGRLGPKGKGGPTLTGELGYEVAWLPDENRSMILGANGPQMIDLPGNAVVWNHEQSKKILKQKSIPIGSQANPYTKGDSTGYEVTYGSDNGKDTGSGKGKGGRGKGGKDNKTGDKVKATSKKVYQWWEKISRQVKAVERKANKLGDKLTKTFNDIRASIDDVSEANKDFIKAQKKSIELNQNIVDTYTKKLTNLNKNGKASRTTIKYKKGGKEKTAHVNIGKFIKLDPDTGQYYVDKKAINAKTKDSKAKRRAIRDKAYELIDKYQERRDEAQDAVDKAKEELANYRKEIDDTFFGWENELTAVYKVTKQIENTSARIALYGAKFGLTQKKMEDLDLFSGGLKTTGLSNFLKDMSKNTQEEAKQLQINRDNLKTQEVALEKEKAEKGVLSTANDSFVYFGSDNQRHVTSEEIAYDRIKSISSEEGEEGSGRDWDTLSENEKKLYAKGFSLRSGFIKEENGEFTFDADALRQAIKEGKISEELGGLITSYFNELNELDGAILQNQQDQIENEEAIYDNSKQMEEVYKSLSDEIYNWKNSLTEILQITQQIEESEKRTSFLKSATDYYKTKQTAEGGVNPTDILSAHIGQLVSSINQIQQRADLATQKQQELTDYLSGATIQKEINQLRAEQSRYNKDSDEWKVIEEAIKTTQKTADAAMDASKYVTFTRNADGSISANYDEAKIEADRASGVLTGEKFSEIEKWVEEAVTKSGEIQDIIANNLSDITELYTTLNNLRQEYADRAKELREAYGAYQQKQIDAIKTLYSAIDNAFKELISNVKQSIQQRRQQEDNAKTEQDIAKKQQRLAALRSNTSGGNQVAIAQLEKEIADAQQAYGRTLEDQLIDRISQQGDEAAKQRQQQVDLMQTQRDIAAKTGQDAAEINAWLHNPEAHKSEISEVLKSQENWEALTQAEQTVFNNALDTKLLELQTLPKEIEDTQTAIGKISPQITATEKSIKDSTSAALQVATKDVKDAFNQGQKTTDSSIVDTAKTLIEQKAIDEIAKITEEQKPTPTPQPTSQPTPTVKTVDPYEGWKQSGYTEEDLKLIGRSKEQFIGMSPGAIDHAIGFEVQKAKEAQENYNAFLNARGSKANSGDRYWGTIGKAGLNKAIEYGEGFNKTKSQIFGDLAFTDALTWKEVIKAAKEAGYTVSQLIKIRDDSDWSNTAKNNFGKAVNEVYDLPKKNKNGKITQKKLKTSFKTGGIADFTGPAWLDGTPSKPELVLNARDTQNFIALRDVLSKALGATNSVTNSYGGNATYEININVDKIEKDYDVDRVAERVKKIIVKDSGYRNVTQVRNFR